MLWSGMTAGQIAEMVGCSTGTVLLRQREAGAPVRRRGERGPDRRPRRSGSGSPRHGHTSHSNGSSAIYGVWQAMIARCTNPAHKNWRQYGGRGVTVCSEWRDFRMFLAFVSRLPNYPYDEGGCRVVFGRSIDRVDNDGNYEPGNVRWASQAEQHSNRRPRRAVASAA